MRRIVTPLRLLLLAVFTNISGQQPADTRYNPGISTPAYKRRTATCIYIDEGHNNFLTKEARYKSFSNLLNGMGKK